MNAALTAWGKIPALITTLGTLYIFRGADYAWVHGRQVNAVNVPGSFLAIGTSTFLRYSIADLDRVDFASPILDRLTAIPDRARILCDWKQSGGSGCSRE